MTVANPTESTLDVSWGAVTGADSYDVYYSLTGSEEDYSYVATVTEAFYQDWALAPETTYYYEVYAFNDSGYGAVSEPASATTLAY